jgi:DNA (cytosine-5)-methyltransferase 1
MEDLLSSSKRAHNQKSRTKEGGLCCYHCGSSSHRAKSCPNATCRLCGEGGHDVGGCPDKPLSPVDLGQFKAHTQTRVDKPGGGFSYIELFCGMGGFRVALDKLGGTCVFASEIDRFCVHNYQANFGDRPAGDICRIPTHEIPNHDLLVGGFPCQPFSSSGARLGIHDPNGKGVLFLEIVRILKGKQPRAFLLENVRGLYLHDNGNTLKRVVKELEECGYIVKYELVDAVRLLPQERCRLFLVGIRRDLHLSKNQAQQTEFEFPNLPHLGRGIQDILHHPEDGHLTAFEMEKLTLNPNQLNKVQSQKYTREHPEARFLSDPTVAAKTIQSSYTKYMVGSQFIPVQFGKHDNGNNEWRRFSSREVARLQGFPESFRLCTERAYHMIGNAVAPPVIVMIAAPLVQLFHLGGGGDDDWGWTIAQSLLLEASPDDSRRKELESKLCLVGTGVMSSNPVREQ